MGYSAFGADDIFEHWSDFFYCGVDVLSIHFPARVHGFSSLVDSVYVVRGSMRTKKKACTRCWWLVLAGVVAGSRWYSLAGTRWWCLEGFGSGLACAVLAPLLCLQ